MERFKRLEVAASSSKALVAAIALRVDRCLGWSGLSDC